MEGDKQRNGSENDLMVIGFLPPRRTNLKHIRTAGRIPSAGTFSTGKVDATTTNKHRNIYPFLLDTTLRLHAPLTNHYCAPSLVGALFITKETGEDCVMFRFVSFRFVSSRCVQCGVLQVQV